MWVGRGRSEWGKDDDKSVLSDCVSEKRHMEWVGEVEWDVKRGGDRDKMKLVGYRKGDLVEERISIQFPLYQDFRNT